MSKQNQQIVVVTGKGGVGKSTVAAAIASRAARDGQKVLLVELGDQSFFGSLYGNTVTYEPTPISENLDISIYSGESCLREYVFHLLRVRKIVDLFFNNKVMRTFVRAAPALKELAVLGKLTSGVRGWGPPMNYNLIVLDGYSTGHLLALLNAPIGMAELFESGPMGEQSRSIVKTLKDKSHLKFVIVTLPEELPVTEAIELHNDLISLLGQAAIVICNRFYTPPPKADAHLTPFLMKKIELQNSQWNILNSSIPHVRNLPFIFSTEGKTIVDELSKEINLDMTLGLR